MASSLFNRLKGATAAINVNIGGQLFERIDTLLMIYYAIGYRGYVINSFASKRQTNYIKDEALSTDISLNPTALLNLSLLGVAKTFEFAAGDKALYATDLGRYAQFGDELQDVAMMDARDWQRYLTTLVITMRPGTPEGDDEMDMMFERLRLAIEAKARVDVGQGTNRDKVGRLPNTSVDKPGNSPADIAGAIGSIWNTIFGNKEEESVNVEPNWNPTPEEELGYPSVPEASESYDDWGYEPDDWYGSESPSDYEIGDESDYGDDWSVDESEDDYDWYEDDTSDLYYAIDSEDEYE